MQETRLLTDLDREIQPGGIDREDSDCEQRDLLDRLPESLEHLHLSRMITKP